MNPTSDTSYFCVESPGPPSDLFFEKDSQDWVVTLMVVYYIEQIQSKIRKGKKCIKWSLEETRYKLLSVLQMSNSPSSNVWQYVQSAAIQGCLLHLSVQTFYWMSVCRHREPLWPTSGTKAPCLQKESKCSPQMTLSLWTMWVSLQCCKASGMQKHSYTEDLQRLSSQELPMASHENGSFLDICRV